MSLEYVIPDVSAELVMDIAKILANSATPLTRDEVAKCFEKTYSPQYIVSALTVCCQLGLAEEKDRSFTGSEKLRSDIKRAARDELYIPFQACLKNYTPFLLYVDFVSKGYDSMEAAARTRGILKARTTLENIEKSLRRWGVYSGLIEHDKKTGTLVLKIEVERFTAEYVMRLLRAFEAELKAKVFLIDMLGPDMFAYLEQKRIGLDDLTMALFDYEVDPKGAASKATQTFELFLWRLGEDAGVDVARFKGPIEIADAIRTGKIILANHSHLCHGIGGIRNMTHHDPDKETGQPWVISKQGALLVTLLVPAAIRSLYMYFKQKKQEF